MESPVGQGFLGKSGRHLLDFVFYIINDFQRVGTIPGDHDTADCFDTFFIQPAAPRTRTDIYKRYIGDAYRYTVTNRHDGLFQVGYIFDIAQAADQIFDLIDLHCLGADIEIAFLDRPHNIHNGNIKGAHGIRIQLDLVLFHETSG